jgi:phospholipase C
MRRDGPGALGWDFACRCSQVFDHTSVIQLLEKIWSHKTGRTIREENLTAWRRAVCGDLTSSFRAYEGEKIPLPKPVEKDAFLESIHQAQFKQLPSGYRKFSAAEMAKVRSDPLNSSLLPQQEPGTRPSCALPYELWVDGGLSADRKSFVIRFAVGRRQFGDRAAGAPFQVYAPGRVRAEGKDSSAFVEGRTWSYTVTAGDSISDSYMLSDFPNGSYYLRVQGPNGFFREFRGTANDPAVGFALAPALPAGNIASAVLQVTNRDSQQVPAIEVEDRAYGGGRQALKPDQASLTLSLGRSHGWYDFSVRVSGVPGFEQRFAGRIETGVHGISDPFMGRVTL